MTKANSHIRDMIKKADVYQWQVADVLGISEVTLIRWLRTDLKEEKEERIVQAIEQLKTEVD